MAASTALQDQIVLAEFVREFFYFEVPAHLSIVRELANRSPSSSDIVRLLYKGRMQKAGNNYAPPKAAIADVEPANHAKTPPEVVGAVTVLWTLAGWTALGSLTLLRQTRPAGQVGSLLVVMVLSILAYCIGKRSRGARIVLLVFVGLLSFGVCSQVLSLAIEHRSQPLGEIAISLVVVTCSGALFTRRASAWFKAAARLSAA